MHLIYIDDSKDDTLAIFSALSFPSELWSENISKMETLRQHFNVKYGMYRRKELHATKFIGGRGRPAKRFMGKMERARVFGILMLATTRLSGMNIFNVVAPRKEEERAFEYLLNRINRTLQAWGTRGILICDEGKEATYTKMVRRMRVYNPIPSKFGKWESGQPWKSIPLDRIIEDPIFRVSRTSHFIQLADACAFALLRKERPIASQIPYKINQMFDLLTPVLFKQANPGDSQGVIRLK